MSTTVILTAAFIAAALFQIVDSPRQARRQAARVGGPDAGTAPHDRLVAELTVRLRSFGSGMLLGTAMAAVPLLTQSVGAHGPAGLTVVATLTATVVVTAVACETAVIVRRTPRRDPDAPRTASLQARSAHTSPLGAAVDVTVTGVAVASIVLAILAVAQGIDGASGAVGAAAGAIAVVAACVITRRRVVRRTVVARDRADVVVDEAAGAATADRLDEQLVMVGGVLCLASLLVPAIAWAGTPRVVAVVLGLAVLATMLASIVVRHDRGTVSA